MKNIPFLLGAGKASGPLAAATPGQVSRSASLRPKGMPQALGLRHTPATLPTRTRGPWRASALPQASPLAQTPAILPTRALPPASAPRQASALPQATPLAQTPATLPTPGAEAGQGVKAGIGAALGTCTCVDAGHAADAGAAASNSSCADAGPSRWRLRPAVPSPRAERPGQDRLRGHLLTHCATPGGGAGRRQRVAGGGRAASATVQSVFRNLRARYRLLGGAMNSDSKRVVCAVENRPLAGRPAGCTHCSSTLAHPIRPRFASRVPGSPPRRGGGVTAPHSPPFVTSAPTSAGARAARDAAAPHVRGAGSASNRPG